MTVTVLPSHDRSELGVAADYLARRARGETGRPGVVIGCRQTADSDASAMVLAQGILQVPAFRPDPPWLSATIVDPPWPELDDLALAHADSIAARVVERRLGGAWWADPPPAEVLARSGAGLAVVSACMMSATATRSLLQAACDRVGAARTVLLVPEPLRRVGAGRRIMREAQRVGCRSIAGVFDPWPLLDCTAEFLVGARCSCNHHVGMLARLAGIPVHQAGQVGAGPAARERAAATLVAMTAYADPFTGQPCSAERALELVELWQRTCTANRRVAACVGVQFWKRRRAAQFFHTGNRPPRFSNGGAALAHAAATGGAIAAWASRIPPGLPEAAATAGVPLLRIEDGFVRSVGLGSDFNAPCSIVVDEAGLYYDPRRPSDLENLLSTHPFPPDLLARAAGIIRRLVAGGTTKYGTGTGSLPPLPTDGRRCILVPGQVADDLSVRLGAGAARSNAELLQTVRAGNTDAFIVYKPHPDVVAGHRPGALADAEVLRHADTIARGGAMAPLIGAVDEVHTMTSLAGFEALLRGRGVTVYGRPFYAGWGLTDDHAPLERRGRPLSLEALAAGVLLLYPRYIDPITGLPCPIEILLDRMADPGLWPASPLVRLRRLQGRAVVHLRKVSRDRKERKA